MIRVGKPVATLLALSVLVSPAWAVTTDIKGEPKSELELFRWDPMTQAPADPLEDAPRAEWLRPSLTPAQPESTSTEAAPKPAASEDRAEVSRLPTDRM